MKEARHSRGLSLWDWLTYSALASARFLPLCFLRRSRARALWFSQRKVLPPPTFSSQSRHMPRDLRSW